MAQKIADRVGMSEAAIAFEVNRLGVRATAYALRASEKGIKAIWDRQQAARAAAAPKPCSGEHFAELSTVGEWMVYCACSLVAYIPMNDVRGEAGAIAFHVATVQA